MNHSTPVLPVYHQLPEFTQTHVHRVADAIQPSHPLSSPYPPASSPSQHQGLFHESTLSMRWPKYWSFSISPSSEHLGLIFFRMDWLNLLAVQGTLRQTSSWDHMTKISTHCNVALVGTDYLTQFSHWGIFALTDCSPRQLPLPMISAQLAHTWSSIVYSLSSVQFFVILWTVPSQAPLSMGFPRQEY